MQTILPSVNVPVLSISTVSTAAIPSMAYPSLTRIPLRAMLPMAAVTAVGVASTRAHGQNTTRTVTILSGSPVTSRVDAAAIAAIRTMYLAQRSTVRDILVSEPESCTSLTISA